MEDEEFSTSKVRLFYSGLPLKSREIFFVESGYNEKVNDYIISHYTKLLSLFARNGFIFRYMPVYTHHELASSQLLTYTGGDETEVVAPCLVYWSDDYENINKSNEDLTLKSIAIGREVGLDKRFKEIAEYLEPPFLEDGYDLFTGDFKLMASPAQFDKLKKMRWKKLVNELQSFQDDFPSIAELWDAIRIELQPNDSMVIDKDHRILLKNYGNKELLANKPLAKAFYFLYLRHEEGIRTKELNDYLPEYKAIYRCIKGKPLSDDDNKRLVNLYSSSVDRIHEIKISFASVVNEKSIGSYIINGAYGMEKKIQYPRNRVTWECEDIPKIAKSYPVRIQIKKLD